MINIDRKQIYQIDSYSYKNFINLSDYEKHLVWKWRNDEHIRQWMLNKAEIPFENHLKFIDSLKQRNDLYYWLVYKKTTPVGVFDIVDVDILKGEAEPGYYLDPLLLNSGEGLYFNYYYRFFFHNILNFPFLKGHILCGNNRAYIMSSFFKVKATHVTNMHGNNHLVMKGSKENFMEISKETLLKDFVKFAKLTNIDWNTLIEELDNE